MDINDEVSYEITLEKQELFYKLIELLTEFNRVCNEYNIKYFVCGGTLLGAIRHRGFIPWDDDVDLYLLREDYEKLKAVAERGGVFSKPFFFQNPSTDPGYPKGFSRLRNTSTTALTIREVIWKCEGGIFIDIFPLDVLPDSRLKFQFQVVRLKLLRMLMNVYARYFSDVKMEKSTWYRKILYNLIAPAFKTGLLTMSQIFERFEKIASRYQECDTKRIGEIVCTFGNERFMFKKTFFDGKIIWVDFENIKIPVPENYDEFLLHIYGEDYMIPKQVPTEHGDMLFSTTIPHVQYIKEHYTELKEKLYG